MAPSRKFKHLVMHLPRAAFGDSKLEIQAFEALIQGRATEIENVDDALEVRLRVIDPTDAINNYESAEKVAAIIVTEKESIQGNFKGDITEDLVQKGTADEKAAKKPDCEDIVVEGVTEQNKIGDSSEGDSVQVDLLLLGINMEDGAEKNNIEKGVIARNAPGILMDNSSNPDPNHAFENSEAYYHIILKIDGGAVGEEVVKDVSEDDNDGTYI
ncbi:hypothetical protein BPAE_0149g00310 [Botrytis paeoniae]|uniref:Uncharacterized protein n=1 Tax=Botrytis paeoniae TaxID=278948 RepID=A0A4Z1FI58_9HELO|nr:hypothetical protein BPAE_0149g00310 [Botrytis paeoniae]